MTSSLKKNRHGTDSRGFTLPELLVVIGIVAVLALTLGPALAAPKPGNKAAECLNNKRQLTIAWLMYASDNADSLISPTTWVGDNMSWSSSPQNTNTALLTDPGDAPIASYNRSAAVFKCPADYYQSAANPGPRVRSVSLNLVLGGSPTIQGGTYIKAKKLTDLAKPGPAMVYVFLDEQADSINDGAFAFDPGYAQGSERWRDLPAAYHNGACAISFADGHAEMHTWLETRGVNKTTYPV
jgi:prepilin-type N-terminal cleavage/methylation domain-containing protein/prepilin-type processing-associated H-X9-DG protein